MLLVLVGRVRVPECSLTVVVTRGNSTIDIILVFISAVVLVLATTFVLRFIRDRVMSSGRVAVAQKITR